MIWANWKSEDIGIKVKGTPAVATWREGCLHVFIRSLDDHVYYRSYENETWQGANWTDLSDGHTFETSPAAVSWGPDRIDLFGVWNKEVQHRAFQSGTWIPWTENLGGVTLDAPAAASWKRERVDVLVHTADHLLSRRYWEAGALIGWKEWENVGGQQLNLVSAPAAVATASNRVDCFGLGPNDGHIIHTWYQDGNQQAWAEIDNLKLSDPPAVVSGITADRGRVDVFIRGTDEILRHRIYYTTQATQPGDTMIHIAQPGDYLLKIARKYKMKLQRLKELNPQITPPDYIVHPGDRIVVTSPPVPGAGGWEPGGNWEHINTNRIASPPAAVGWWSGNVLKRIDVFAQDPNNNLFHTWWT